MLNYPLSENHRMSEQEKNSHLEIKKSPFFDPERNNGFTSSYQFLFIALGENFMGNFKMNVWMMLTPPNLYINL